jgi:hypothetical protein
MIARSPRVATWLLRRFSSGPHGEAIAGDLMERYALRPSRVWYWRQVLSAIRADILTTVSAHKWRTVAAVAVGWIAYFAASFPANWLVRSSRPFLRRWLSDLEPEWFLWVLRVQSTIIVTIACVAVGWIVSTVSRRSAPAAVSILAITVMIFEYAMIGLFLNQRPPSVSIVEFVAPALLVLSRPAGVLAGGLIATRTRSHEPDLPDPNR